MITTPSRSPTTDECVVRIEITGTTTTIRVRAELDVHSCAAAATSLVRVAKSAPAHLHIVAGEVSFIDSTGVAALAMVASKVRADGGTVAMSASPPVRRVITLCGMGCHFGLTDH